MLVWIKDKIRGRYLGRHMDQLADSIAKLSQGRGNWYIGREGIPVDDSSVEKCEPVIACVRDSPNGTIGNFTKVPLVANGTIGNQRTLNVSRQPMVPLVPMLPLVETLVPMVPFVVPMVPLVVPMVPLVSPMVSTVI